MKIVITLSENELKEAAVEWLVSNSESVQADNFGKAKVSVVRDAATGAYTAVVEVEETFDVTGEPK